VADPIELTIGSPSAQRVDSEVLRTIRLDDVAGELGDDPDGDPPEVDDWMVRGVLRSVVEGGLGLVFGDPDAPELWDFTDKELEGIVPPLTRIINRRPALRAAVIRGDEAVVAVIFASYLGRNFADRRRVRRAREDVVGQVPTGQGAADQASASGDRRVWPGAGDGFGHAQTAGGGVA
jgi:hypothetical protein